MSRPDLNLLVTLDVLLAEGSVARAARRLRLSPSAMSRALARLRETTGDPLLVRAGRALVPTPRAVELRERVGRLVRDAEAVLRPAERLDLGQLVRTFTLRTSDGFVENYGPGLIARAGEEAPGVRLRFVQKVDRDSTPLRDGTVDLETGVVGQETGPELRARALFRDRFIGVVRMGHPLGEGDMTPARYAKRCRVVKPTVRRTRIHADIWVMSVPGLRSTRLSQMCRTSGMGFAHTVTATPATPLVRDQDSPLNTGYRGRRRTDTPYCETNR